MTISPYKPLVPTSELDQLLGDPEIPADSTDNLLNPAAPTSTPDTALESAPSILAVPAYTSLHTPVAEDSYDPEAADYDAYDAEIESQYEQDASALALLEAPPRSEWEEYATEPPQTSSELEPNVPAVDFSDEDVMQAASELELAEPEESLTEPIAIAPAEQASDSSSEAESPSIQGLDSEWGEYAASPDTALESAPSILAVPAYTSLHTPVAEDSYDPEAADYDAYDAEIESQYEQDASALALLEAPPRSEWEEYATEPPQTSSELEPNVPAVDFSDEDVMQAASELELAEPEESLTEPIAIAPAEQASDSSSEAESPSIQGLDSEWGEYAASPTAEPAYDEEPEEPNFEYEPEPVALETELEPANPTFIPLTEEQVENPPDEQQNLVASDLPEDGYDPEQLEAGLDEFNDPRIAKSIVAITGNPFVKAAVVGALGLVLILFVGAVYSAVTGGGKKSASLEKLEAEATPSPTEPVTSHESGKLKGELAFASQQNDMDKSRRMQSPQASPTPTRASSPTPIAHSVPLPAPPAPVAPVAPLPAAPAPVLAQSIITPSPTDPYAGLSPVERWQQIATAGSFGHVSPSTARPPQTTAPVALASPSPASVQPYTPPAQTAQAVGGNLAQLRSSSTTPGLRTAPLSDVLVGTTATGAMQTAVILGEDNAQAVNPTDPAATKYLVRLSSPIKDAQGAVALSAGTTLVAVVSGFSPQTGMMQMAVTGVISNNREYAVPQGAIAIRGTDGGSLRSQRIGGGNALSRAVVPSIFSGISHGAETLTRQSGTTTTNGSVTTTTSSGNPNAGAGFIQGFSGSLSEQINQATQAANSQNQNRPRAWRLSVGAGVQVFVNSTFQM